MHPFHDYLCQQLDDMLKKRGLVVFYDPRREFEPFFDRELKETGTGYDGLPRVFLNDRLAFLARHEGSFFALRNAVEAIADLDEPESLIVYLPGVSRERLGRMRFGSAGSEDWNVLFEVDQAGTSYQPQLRSLARNYLRRVFTDGQIDEMLRPASVGYDDIVSFLKQGEEGKSASVLRTIFDGAQSEALITGWLADDEKDATIVEKDAAVELFKLIESRLGVSIPDATAVTEARDKLFRYTLVSEFRSDLECDPPHSVAMVPEPPSKEHVERIRQVAESLRRGHAETYVEHANKVEGDMGLGKTKISASHLGNIDTFRFEERALLAYGGELICDGDYAKALGIIAKRGRSFWVDRDFGRQAQWEACRLMAELGCEIERVRKNVANMAADPSKWASAYAEEEGWHRADQLQRVLETWVSKMEEEPEAERALGLVRRDYEELLRIMAEGFSKALIGSGWSIPGILHQTRIHPELVEARSREGVAYFLVDALRYEMGVELSRMCEGAEELKVQPAVAALPTITPIGMAALLPGSSASFSVVESKGKLAARIDGSEMPILAARQKYLKAAAPDAIDLPLWEVLSKSRDKLAKLVSGSSLILVRSKDLDALGEGGDDWLARQVMDTVVGNIARAVRKLSNAGVRNFVISADHGYQFSLKKESDMRTDNPKGDSVSPHRRCWIGRGGDTPAGCVRVSGAELGYDTDLEFVFPTGLAVFSAQGGLSYHHGGISLQELIVPVITMRFPGPAVAKKPESAVTLKRAPEAVTNRTFGVDVSVTRKGLFDMEPLTLRVALMAEGELVGQTGMVVGGDFDRSTGCVTIEPNSEVSVGLMLAKDDCKRLRIVVLDAKTDAVLAQSEEIPVKLGI